MCDAKHLREILSNKDVFVPRERFDAILNDIPRINREDRHFVDLVLLNAAMDMYGSGILKPLRVGQFETGNDRAFIHFALANWQQGSRTEDEFKQLLGAIKECGTVVGDQIYRTLAPRTVLVKSKC